MSQNTDKLSEKWTNRNTPKKDAEKPKEPVENLTFKTPANEALPKKEEDKIERKHFALDDEHKIASIKIKFKDGNRLYQPYVGISFMDYDRKEGLTIHSGKRKINIKGRNLETLADHLSNLNVDWITESKTGNDDNRTEIFIEKITLDA